MARKPKERKTDVVVAFKVEAELAALLDKLPNKSAFIRKAIAAQLGRVCPLCAGKGVVPRGVHDHFAPLIETNRDSSCEKCGTTTRVPIDEGELHPDDRARLEQFFLGGPLFCDDCYDEVPPCSIGDCGMHIEPEHVADHVRQAHRD